MLFRQKLAFFVFGCVVVGQLVTGLVVPSATAQSGLQDAEFNEVAVRKLTVVDEATGTRHVEINPAGVGVHQPDGTLAVLMTTPPSGGGLVAVYHPDGAVGATVTTLPDGGFVSVHHPDGEMVAHVGALPGLW